MKLFIPTIPEDKTYDFLNYTVIKYIESLGFSIFIEKQVYKLEIRDKYKKVEIVGEYSNYNNEAIFVILETVNEFLICTPNNGITGNYPLIINKDIVENITYFSESKKNTFKYGDFVYKLDYGNHFVEFPNKIPDSIFKYYNNVRNSRNAIINEYLFCSHPYHLNDAMDCSNILWDFSNINEKKYNGFFDFYKNEPLIKKKVNFESDKENNFESIKNAFWDYISNKFGLISFSENPLHILMWSHYSSERGFMVEFDSKKLFIPFKKKNPKVKNYVFMPIQYVEKLEKIDFFSEVFTTPDVPFLYSINIKRNEWAYENEWRLVCYSDSYGIPYSLLKPEEDYTGKNERKFFYDKSIIKSLTLGKYFFNGSNISAYEKPNTYTIKCTENIEFIDFIFKNFNDRLYISDELESEKMFVRNRIPVVLSKIEDNVFKLTKIC